MSMTLSFHPAADLFPLIEGTEFTELVADVTAHGVREPITLYDGKILDGRNRYRAAQAAGVECPTRVYDGDDPLAFVISENLRRRHLHESQRAMVAAKLVLLWRELPDNGVKSAAAIERWSREAELEEIRSSDLEYDAKQNLFAHLKGKWQRADKKRFLQNRRQVYVAGSGDKMKVGVSSWPIGRVDTLKVGHPNIALIDSWPGTFAAEKEVHRLLAKYALGGEWFVYSPETFQIVATFMQEGKFAQVHVSANEKAAKALNVSERSIKSAIAVAKDGITELASAVERGAVSVSAAADIARYATKEEQRQIIAACDERDVVAATVQIRARKSEIRHAARINRIANISAGSAPLQADRKYPIILADPPWDFHLWDPDYDGRAVAQHYPTMELVEIAKLPVSDMATNDAAIFLWTTNAHLQSAFEVMGAWGFEYITNIVWTKNAIGLGQWCRNQHEILLVGRRGDIPAPLPANRPSSVITAPRREHSRKPIEAYELIERMYPDLPKIELFARQARDGWSCWGNQAPMIAEAA
jgi:N6-adenosine-specific RNA methylase IME4